MEIHCENEKIKTCKQAMRRKKTTSNTSKGKAKKERKGMGEYLRLPNIPRKKKHRHKT
jgi:hypothetical protein